MREFRLVLADNTVTGNTKEEVIKKAINLVREEGLDVTIADIRGGIREVTSCTYEGRTAESIEALAEALALEMALSGNNIGAITPEMSLGEITSVLDSILNQETETTNANTTGVAVSVTQTVESNQETLTVAASVKKAAGGNSK